VLVAFGLHQRHRARQGRSSLVEPSLFRDRGFPAALASSALFFAVTTGLMLVVVLELQLGLHADVLTAGLTLLPWSCGLAVSSVVAGTFLMPRFGPRVMFAGLALLVAGVLAAIACYGAEPASAYPWPLLIALGGISGLGIGVFTTPFFTAALHRVRPHETGSAAGLLNAVQQLGGTLGVAVLGSVFLGSAAPAPAAAQQAFWVAAGLLVAATVSASLILPRRDRSSSALPDE
jgi:MFS family permease